MPKRYHLSRPVMAQTVAAQLQISNGPRDQQRLLAAKLAASGQFTAAQIADRTGVSRRRFFDWMNALKGAGLEGLLQRKHGGGAPPRVRGLVLTELQMGLGQHRWKRAEEVRGWLRERHGVRLTLPGVYYWLGKLGGLSKSPRKPPAP
jgi:transposase